MTLCYHILEKLASALLLAVLTRYSCYPPLQQKYAVQPAPD